MARTLIGTGILDWQRFERQSGRYGAFALFAPKDEDEHVVLAPQPELVGAHGKLVVKVLKTRQSTHLGDWGRGISPATPTVGEEIILGAGALFFEDEGEEDDRLLAVGVRPADDEYPWMDPGRLYRVHQQTVEVYFVQEEPACVKST